MKLPDLQPGSSIMPGKVNPVMCESLMQVAARVMGNDQTIAVCGAAGGQFQLNIMMPVMADDGAGEHPAAGRRPRTPSPSVPGRDGGQPPRPARRPSRRACRWSPGLNPYIGYERAAALAKEAFKTGKTIRELCREKNVLPEGPTRRGARPLADDASHRRGTFERGFQRSDPTGVSTTETTERCPKDPQPCFPKPFAAIW